MNQTTYSFPQIISRGTYKTNLSSGNKSINECLGILLRTRPGELLGFWLYVNTKNFYVPRYYCGSFIKRRYYKCCISL